MEFLVFLQAMTLLLVLLTYFEARNRKVPPRPEDEADWWKRGEPWE